MTSREAAIRLLFPMRVIGGFARFPYPALAACASVLPCRRPLQKQGAPAHSREPLVLCAKVGRAFICRLDRQI